MRLSQRSFPHPVVGNADDVVDVAFQAPVEMYHDSADYYLRVVVQCSSKTISQLVKNGDATYVLHVECSNTLYRRAFEFSDVDREFSIPSDQLNSTVEVNVFVVARRDIPKYKVDNAHPDYGATTFSIGTGDVLAVGETFTFEADIDFDALRSVSSIMQIRERSGPNDQPMELDFSGDKIAILLSPNDFAMYQTIKTCPPIGASIMPAIVLSALIKAIEVIKDQPANYEDLRWFRCLKRRIDHMNLSIETESLELAQEVLELPIKRAFSTAKAFLEIA